MEFVRDRGNDRENWAGHVCLGRDRFTITFQLIKNKHLQNATDSITRNKQEIRTRLMPLQCKSGPHFHRLVSVFCLRTFRGITQGTGTQGSTSRVAGESALYGMRVYRAAVCAALAGRAAPHYAGARRTAIRNSKYLRNVT